MLIPNIIICFLSAAIYTLLARFHYSLPGAWIPWVYFIFGYIFSFTPTNIFERAETAGVLEKKTRI